MEEYVGAPQFFRRLEDLVGKETANKILAYQYKQAEEICGQKAVILGGYTLYSGAGDIVVNAAFRVPLDKNMDTLKLCRHFREVRGFDGALVSCDSFDAIHSDYYRGGFGNFFERLVSKSARESAREISAKLQEFQEFHEVASEPVRKLIQQIPIVVCPLSREVVSAHFGKGTEGYFLKKDFLKTEDYFKNPISRDFFNWELRSKAYAIRMDAIVIEYPSGKPGFVRFVNQVAESAEKTAQATVAA